jgi:4-amino-4-deoxy-L-arabinose transferase-like glycosyltransferase
MGTDATARLLPGPQTLKGLIKPRTSVLLVFWLSIAALLTLRNHLAALGEPFDYVHTANGSYFSTEARSFVEHGVIALGGVPIRNNPPLGLTPDINTHWPPLFPIVLSVAFRIFGESESVAHGLMLAILFASSLALYALVNACCGRLEALFAVFASLIMPTTIIYGYIVMPQHLAILCMLLALLGFVKATSAARLHRGWTAFGLVSFAVAILTSWEPLLICPGLLAVAIWQRRPSPIRLALLYSSVGAVVFVGILTTYTLYAPSLARELWGTFLVRMGFTPLKSTQFHLETASRDYVYSRYGAFSLRKHLVHFVEQLSLIGPLATAALGGVLVTGWTRRHSDNDGRVVFLFGGLLSPWFLWFILMRNHAHIHDFMMLLAVPGASAALGLSAVTLLNLTKDSSIPICRLIGHRWLLPLVVGTIFLGMLGGEFIIAHYRPKPKGLLATLEISSIREWQAALMLGGIALLILRKGVTAVKKITLSDIYWGLLIILPMVMLVPMIIKIENRLKDPEWANSRIVYAYDIYANTEPGVIVLSPDRSLAVTYYSKRHVILGIRNDFLVDKAMKQVPNVFPGSLVYLALRPEDLKEFPRSLQRYPVLKQTTHLVLLPVPTANTDTKSPQTIEQ